MLNETEVLIRIGDLESRASRNEKSIEDLQQTTKAVQELATSMAVMAETQKTQTESLKLLQSDVREIKNIPGKRWDQVIDKVVFGTIISVIGIVVGYALNKIFT